MTLEEIGEKYRDFLEETDRLCQSLSDFYGDKLCCSPRCSSCCQSLTLLPIEWFAMKRGLEESGIKKRTTTDGGSCPFLSDELCSLYDWRPLICRTHGFPLLYLDQDGTGWELSCCELNLPNIDQEKLEELFEKNYLLNMEKLNSHLSQLNSHFLKTREGSAYSRSTRLSMDALLGQSKE